MKILLIEDSKFQRIANGRALVKAGYGVIHSVDGDEGLRIARENIPDLILLDMMLPKLSGPDVLRALNADVLVKHIPVIVRSGLGQANEAKLLKEGAAAFLVKSKRDLPGADRQGSHHCPATSGPERCLIYLQIPLNRLEKTTRKQQQSS
jgi:twitching motility two-component system response regulator PilH